MRIEVRRHGFGTYVPEGLNRYIQIGDSVITDPKWINYHRSNPPLQAVNSDDELLSIGEYDGSIFYQYYVEGSETWLNFRNLKTIREMLSRGMELRLVFVAKERRFPKVTNSNKVPINIKEN